MSSHLSKQTPPNPQTAVVLSIGTELTLGRIVDTNAAWLSRRLADIGVRCVSRATVPDDVDRIANAFRSAATIGDIVIASGGLGPTADDLTREALATAAGVELVTDPASITQIREFFARRQRTMPPENQLQARIPSTGRAIHNSCGTAPGIAINVGGHTCYALPGVPFEMRAMFDHQVLPELRAATGGQTLRSRLLHCFGMSEAEIGGKLADLMIPGTNPAVGTQADSGVISVRIDAHGDSPQVIDNMLASAEATVRERLGPVVFGTGEDSLEAVVGGRLAARGETLAVAESCTGGLIAKMLTDVPGSSRYFIGAAVTYANELKQNLLGVSGDLLARFGAVSEPVARAMADGARQRFGATYALATTGIAGPGGGTPDKLVGLVFVACAGPDQVDVRELHLGSDAPRSIIRERASRSAINMLRLRLGC